MPSGREDRTEIGVSFRKAHSLRQTIDSQTDLALEQIRYAGPQSSVASRNCRPLLQLVSYLQLRDRSHTSILIPLVSLRLRITVRARRKMRRLFGDGTLGTWKTRTQSPTGAKTLVVSPP